MFSMTSVTLPANARTWEIKLQISILACSTLAYIARVEVWIVAGSYVESCALKFLARFNYEWELTSSPCVKAESTFWSPTSYHKSKREDQALIHSIHFSASALIEMLHELFTRRKLTKNFIIESERVLKEDTHLQSTEQKRISTRLASLMQSIEEIINTNYFNSSKSMIQTFSCSRIHCSIQSYTKAGTWDFYHTLWKFHQWIHCWILSIEYWVCYTLWTLGRMLAGLKRLLYVIGYFVFWICPGANRNDPRHLMLNLVFNLDHMDGLKYYNPECLEWAASQWTFPNCVFTKPKSQRP